ncbi:MAG: class I SAM-dependent methyltransferase [Alphaproteobacteria bacterium]
MSFYNRVVLPWLINQACGGSPVAKQRAKIVPRAKGEVLEVGIGSGLNLPFYDTAQVTKVWGLEPSVELRRMAEKTAHDVDLAVEFLDLPGEDIPLPDHSVDTVVITYTLCTIADTAQALAQMRRVLKPGAELLFCEHGRAPDAGVRRWQDRIDPFWGKFTGGCHLNRPIDALIADAGFRFETMHTMYIPGPRPMSFNYWGAAVAT